MGNPKSREGNIDKEVRNLFRLEEVKKRNN